MLDNLSRMNLTNRRVVEKDLFVTAIDYNGQNDLALLVASQLHIVDPTTLSLKKKLTVQNQIADRALTEIRFVDQNSLIASAADGFIRMWDVRTEDPVLTLASTTRPEANEELKPLLCCDVSLDGSTIASGSEAVKEDAFILFWDIRTSNKLLGGYWDSHSKDVAEVKFHPEEKCLIATGGVDGLVNVFDLEESSEDDAILYTLNIECAVNRLSWLPRSSEGIDRLGVATTEEEFQLWDAEDAEPKARFTRENLQKSNEVVVDHIISAVNFGSEASFVTSANDGTVNIWKLNGELVTSMGGLENKELSSHRDLVKCAITHVIDGKCVMWTSGDDGILCRWVPDTKQKISLPSNEFKAESTSKAKTKSSRNKPY